MSNENGPIQTFKGFDENLQCRGFQYEAGKEYVHEGDVKACEGGFHACEYPLEVLRYYSPNTSRFFMVEQNGTISRHDEDSKVASSRIKIGAEIGLPGLIKAAIEYTMSRAKPIDPNSPAYSVDVNGAATASGYSGAATASGNSGAATASGRHSTASATGFAGRARGIDGAALFLVYRDEKSDGDDYGRILHARAAIVGKDGIKPDTWYSLDASGSIVEAD